MNMWTVNIFGNYSFFYLFKGAADDPKSLLFNFDMDIIDTKLQLVEDSPDCVRLDVYSFNIFMAFCF